jgi:predicted DNA-binding WGR domain protein
MSDWTVYLEREGTTQTEYWRARVEQDTLYVDGGNVGGRRTSHIRVLDSPELAQREYSKLLREKAEAGFVEAEVSAAFADEDEVNDDREPDDEDND